MDTICHVVEKKKLGHFSFFTLKKKERNSFGVLYVFIFESYLKGIYKTILVI